MTVDDQAVFRSVSRAVIDATPGFVSAGEVGSCEEALAQVQASESELALVDVRMPVTGGVETSRRLHAADPELVIVLISVDDPVAVDGTGAAAFVRKQDYGPRMLRELWEIHGSRRLA
jgi:DNA-binding NarL/FixJ family response regulator